MPAINIDPRLEKWLENAVFQFFAERAARRGVKRAVIAVAHTLLVIAYTMLKTGRNYHELGGNYLERINKDQLQRYFVKRLQRLGLKVTVQPASQPV
jgi:transposase